MGPSTCGDTASSDLDVAVGLGAEHDWSSHAADAFRYLAMTLDRTVETSGFNRTLSYPRLGIA